MNIAVVINTHGAVDTLNDTIDSVKYWLTDQILVVIDGKAKYDFADVKIPAHSIIGFNHGFYKAPYRNITLGLMTAAKTWSCDWYCYMEYDCLVASDQIIETLTSLPLDVWCVGNDKRFDNMKLELLELMLKTKFVQSGYFLGCCVFYRGDFIRKLATDDFFNRFLCLTNDFMNGFFPGFEEQGGYDLSEHLYPTMALHYGGKLHQLASWNRNLCCWSGDFQHFPLRWQPDLTIDDDPYRSACLLHPLKDYDNPIRSFHRLKRKTHV